jgi:hypothetical protein
VARPNRRKFDRTGCPGAIALAFRPDNPAVPTIGHVVVSRVTRCDGSHSTRTETFAQMPEEEELLRLVAEHFHDGVRDPPAHPPPPAPHTHTLPTFE